MLTVGHLLHAPADQPAVALLRCHALDLGLLRGEVVGDRIHRVRCVALGEFGLGDDRFAFERIGLAVCIDHLVVHVDLHVVGLEVAVLIGDVALVVDIDHLVAHVVDQRILVLARDRVVEERPRFLGLFLFHRVAGDGVRSAAFERVAFLRDERIELLLRQGFECGAAACLFPGGACLLAAILVLAVMILPSIINVSETALRAVPHEYEEASLALGATEMETSFRVVLPAARSGVATAVVLGVGRAIGEAMAIIMVAGNVSNMPGLFTPVRFLTTGIVSGMAYASVGSLYQQALYSIALVLFLFIMLINVVLNRFIKKRKED